MMDLLTSAMDAGAALAETFSKPVNTGASFTRYGTVVKNNGTTLDVELCGATLAAVPMLTTCAGAKAGDRCLLTVDGPLVTVTGILANADNAHYVKGNCDIFTGSDVVNMNNSDWLDWLSPKEQKKRFGRAINGGNGWDFVSCMNGDINAQAAAIIGTYFYPEGTIGFYTNRIIHGMLRVNYLVVLGR